MPTSAPSRRRIALLLALAAAGAAPVARPTPARADIVDRVVAVIEDDAIFLSEIERRTRPFERELSRIDNPRERAQRREQLYRETLERMVDDALIRRAATRAHITASEADVDRMIEGIAHQRNATSADIYAALSQEGITRTEYRTFMEAEVLRLRVMNQRVRVMPSCERAA
jgi:peptidyl-prolyl cis-trans isomerase SurA